jgi:hypothetical protein
MQTMLETCEEKAGMRMSMAGVAVALLFLGLQGCGQGDWGFRFLGRYEATRSGYRIHVISKGYVKPGADVAESAFAVATICPTGNAPGKSFRATLTATPRRWTVLQCDELGLGAEDMNWKTSEKVLTTLLSTAGYGNLSGDEVRGSAKVMLNALSGPKGVILKGQIESLRVLRTDITYGYSVAKSYSPKTWIEESEFLTCDED